MEDYLTLQELAERSGYSVSTIMRYKKQGKIPFYQPGAVCVSILIVTERHDSLSSPAHHGCHL